MPRRYIVREVPYQRGTRRRVVDRLQYFHEALRVAEQRSAEGRAIEVELRGVQLALWVNGQQVING